MGTSTPSRLLLLPSELGSAILENLQHDRSALLSVCLTCQILHATARPILNRRIVVHSHDRESYETAMGQLPQVTQYVRDLTIHSHIESKASVHPIPASMAGTYQPIDILAIKGYNPLFTDFVPTIDAMNRLEKLTIKGCGYIGAHQAIPSTASDLENLQHNLQTFNSLILRAVQGDSLRRLHTLEIDLCNRGNWYCEIEPFLYHPRLKKLSIMGASISGFRPMHSRLRFSPLEELGLVCCDLSSGTMEGLLAIPKALRRLTFGGSPRSQARERLDYDTQLYVNAIKQQADSLEYLDISPPILLDERREPVDLRSLTALRSLRIRPRTLYGHFNMNPGLSSLSPLFSGNALPPPALPANLRLLRLWCWGVSFRFEAHTSILNNLDSFAVTEPIPSLRYVIIEDSKFVSGDWGVPWDNRGYLTFLGAEPQGPWRFPLDCCWADGA